MISFKGQWDKARVLLNEAPRRLGPAMSKSLLREAEYLREQVVDGINEQSPGGQRFKPLASATIAARKAKRITGTKALIATKTLIKSIKVLRRGDDVFVGIPRSVRSRGGQALVNIGAIHEMGSKDGKIPARPFIKPVLDKWLPEAGERVSKKFAEELKGDYGTV